MGLTPKQELFISEYNALDKAITAECVIKGLIVLYLRAEKHSDRKNAAWLIGRIKPSIKLIGIEKLLDMKELIELAIEKQNDIQKIAKFAQERRHEKRKDFALTDDEWIEAVEYFDNECAYCGDSKSKLTYDHFMPFSKGGSFTEDNIIPCCQKCNSGKSNKEFREWYHKQSFYSANREIKIMNYIEARK